MIFKIRETITVPTPQPCSEAEDKIVLIRPDSDETTPLQDFPVPLVLQNSPDFNFQPDKETEVPEMLMVPAELKAAVTMLLSQKDWSKEYKLTFYDMKVLYMFRDESFPTAQGRAKIMDTVWKILLDSNFIFLYIAKFKFVPKGWSLDFIKAIFKMFNGDPELQQKNACLSETDIGLVCLFFGDAGTEFGYTSDFLTRVKAVLLKLMQSLSPEAPISEPSNNSGSETPAPVTTTRRYNYTEKYISAAKVRSVAAAVVADGNLQEHPTDSTSESYKYPEITKSSYHDELNFTRSKTNVAGGVLWTENRVKRYFRTISSEEGYTRLYNLSAETAQFITDLLCQRSKHAALQKACQIIEMVLCRDVGYSQGTIRPSVEFKGQITPETMAVLTRHSKAAQLRKELRSMMVGLSYRVKYGITLETNDFLLNFIDNVEASKNSLHKAASVASEMSFVRRQNVKVKDVPQYIFDNENKQWILETEND